MTIIMIPVVVRGTGDEDCKAAIRAHCREGSPVQIRRASDQGSTDDRLEVWLQCRSLLGLRKSWKKIGFVEGQRYAALKHRMANGQLRVRQSVVSSFFAPLDREQPQVSIQLAVEMSSDDFGVSGLSTVVRSY